MASILIGEVVLSNVLLDQWDKRWLLQVNTALPSSKTFSGCHVLGFWLEMLPCSEQPDEGCALKLQRGGPTTYYRSLIKKMKSLLSY